MHSRMWPKPRWYITEGECVRLTKALFADIEDICKMVGGERRVMVLIEILSKPVAVHVAPASLHKTS